MSSILPASAWTDQPKYGLYDGVSDEDYHSIRGYVSNSFIKRVRKSSLHAKCTSPEAGVSPALKMGRAVHDAVLRPEVFKSTYAQFAGDRRRKADRERYQGLVDMFGEWSVLTEDEYRHCMGITEAVHAHPIAGPLFKAAGYEELTAIWDAGGLKAKSRFDKLLFDGTIVDLKTTQDATPHRFEWDARKKYRYDQQAAFYTAAAAYHGINVERFIFVAVEKIPPYGISLHQFSDNMIAEAGDEIDELLGRWERAQRTGVYEGYPSDIHIIDNSPFGVTA